MFKISRDTKKGGGLLSHYIPCCTIWTEGVKGGSRSKCRIEVGDRQVCNSAGNAPTGVLEVVPIANIE